MVLFPGLLQASNRPKQGKKLVKFCLLPCRSEQPWLPKQVDQNKGHGTCAEVPFKANGRSLRDFRGTKVERGLSCRATAATGKAMTAVDRLKSQRGSTDTRQHSLLVKVVELCVVSFFIYLFLLFLSSFVSVFLYLLICLVVCLYLFVCLVGCLFVCLFVCLCVCLFWSEFPANVELVLANRWVI